MSQSQQAQATTEVESSAAHFEIQPRALELIQRAEIDMQISTAKKYPRLELAKIRQKMLSFATLDEETAESCFYTLRRWDAQANENKLIQGPSVRLAEIAVACYGNLRAASRVIDNDGKKITSQGACHDLENNVLISVEVSRRITNKTGKTFNDDMQITTGNAANSIAFRNATFKVIPMALVKPVYEQAKRVAVGDATTLSVKREKLFKRFSSMGVETERVLAVLEKASIESVDLDDLTTLIGIGTAIKDGEQTVEEAFPPVRRERGSVSISDFKTSSDPNRGHDATQPPAERAESSAETKPLYRLMLVTFDSSGAARFHEMDGCVPIENKDGVIRYATTQAEHERNKTYAVVEFHADRAPSVDDVLQWFNPPATADTFESWDDVRAKLGDETHEKLGLRIQVGAQRFFRHSTDQTWTREPAAEKPQATSQADKPQAGDTKQKSGNGGNRRGGRNTSALDFEGQN